MQQRACMFLAVLLLLCMQALGGYAEESAVRLRPQLRAPHIGSEHTPPRRRFFWRSRPRTARSPPHNQSPALLCAAPTPLIREARVVFLRPP